MKELLSFEFRKLWRSKSLWICTIVMIVLNIASVVITYSTQRMINNLAGTESIFDLGGTVLASSGLIFSKRLFKDSLLILSIFLLNIVKHLIVIKQPRTIVTCLAENVKS